MDVVSKDVTAQIRPVDSTNPNGEFDLILSDESLDRDGENLWADEWRTPLPDHLHGDTDHAWSNGAGVEKTAGSGVPRLENNELRVRGTYAGTEHGQLTRQLVNEGHVRNASVSYIEHKKGGKIERELLNFTFTGVPANPNAKILSSKAAKTSGAPAGDAPTDTPPAESDQGDMPAHDDLVQAIHDASVHLGAGCLEDADTGESDGANKSYNVLIRLLGEAVLKAAKDPAKPYGDVTYADPKNGKYPVDTEEHARAAWSYINMPKNQAGYTSGELSAIKGRIRAALTKFGVKTDDSSDSKSVGMPQGSAEDSAAATLKGVAAAEDSADDAARARARAHLLKMSMARVLDET